MIQKKFKTAVNALDATAQKISVRKNVEYFMTGILEYIMVRLVKDSIAEMDSASQFKPHYLFKILQPVKVPELEEGQDEPVEFIENELFESFAPYIGKLEYLNECMSIKKDYRESNSWKTYIERIFKRNIADKDKKTFSNQSKHLINRVANLIFDRFIVQSKVNLNMNNIKTIDARNIEACVRGAFSPLFANKAIEYANSRSL